MLLPASDTQLANGGQRSRCRALGDLGVLPTMTCQSPIGVGRDCPRIDGENARKPDAKRAQNRVNPMASTPDLRCPGREPSTGLGFCESESLLARC